MIETVRLAWRNIWRNRRRTVLTASALTLCSAILVFFIALQLSSYAASIEASMSIFQGHLQVQPQGYKEKPEIENVIDDPAEVLELLRHEPRVRGIAARAFGFALVSSAIRS